LRTGVLIESERKSPLAESAADIGLEKPKDLGRDFGIAPSPPPDAHLFTRILIDTPPDLRQQILRVGFREIDAVFYTHAHADHILGLDDLRPFNFRMGREIPVYADDSTAERLLEMFSYAFTDTPGYEGGAPPRLRLNRLEPYRSVTVDEEPIEPISIYHGTKLILGFRIRNFAYLTDCSGIPERSRERLTNLDVLVVSGLRHREHPTHFTIEQAVREISILRPKKAFLTHISHDLEHEETNALLRRISTCETELAYDGLELTL